MFGRRDLIRASTTSIYGIYKLVMALYLTDTHQLVAVLIILCANSLNIYNAFRLSDKTMNQFLLVVIETALLQLGYY